MERQLRAMGLMLAGAGVAMLASDSMLMLSAWADRWLSFLGCLVLITLAVGWKGAGGRSPAAAAAAATGLAIVAWAACRPADPVTRTLLVAWLFALIGLVESKFRRRGAAPPPALASLHLASLAYALGLALYRHSASGWWISEALSRAPLLPGGPAAPWAYGLPVYVFGALVLVSAALLSRAGFRRDLGRRLAGPAVLLAGCLLTAAVVRLRVPTTHLVVSWTHAASLGIVSAVAAAEVSAATAAGTTAAGLAWLPRISLVITLAAALACPPLAREPRPALAGPREAAPGDTSITFALWPAGLLDWRVPGPGAVGLANSGMFGLFRSSLERCASSSGGRVFALDGAREWARGSGQAARAITAESLRGVDAVIFINTTAAPSAEEVECLRSYVEAGGGLLVLGDHTDIGGSRGPLNAVLRFTGIRFNFDSAIPLRQHWRGCLEVRPHQVTRRVAGTPDCDLRCQLAVGASLALSGAATPIVLGRYGFADRGDSLNGGRGAFLGNLVRDGRERVGAAVLVAAQQIGGGRVLVFGDTSPFQNGALLLSQDLVSDALSWVCARDGGQRFELAPYSAAAGIDFSLHPRGGIALFTDGALGGLANCLARRRVAARAIYSGECWNDSPELLFLIGPTRMGSRDAERLLRYMDRGGDVILCQGYADPQPCVRLLEPLGLTITGVPLGDGGRGCVARHNDAWALSCIGAAAGDTAVAASAFGHPTVVTVRRGQGSLTLIGDSGFLLDENLEGEQTANERNVAFLDRLLDGLAANRARGGKPRSAR